MNNFRNPKKKSVCFLPLGGTGEIGMNCYLYHFDGKWLIVDLGVTFSDQNIPNADIILPDLQFIIERKNDPMTPEYVLFGLI